MSLQKDLRTRVSALLIKGWWFWGVSEKLVIVAENTLGQWPGGYSLSSSTWVKLQRTTEVTEIELGCLLEHQPVPRDSSATVLSLYACPGNVCSCQKTLKYKWLEMRERISTGRKCAGGRRHQHQSQPHGREKGHFGEMCWVDWSNIHKKL